MSARLRLRLVGLAVAAAILVAPVATAKNGAFRSSAHGNREKGPQRRSEIPRGSCSQCHDDHASHKGAKGGQHGLFAANDNDLCFSCHAGQGSIGTYPGRGLWNRSAHALSPEMVLRGRDGRDASDVNKCVNCHDPHGVNDAQGLVPSMLVKREKDLCLACHDGSSGADVRAQLLLPYVHGAFARGEHDPMEAADGARSASASRHVSCSDCHNAHRATESRGAAQAPDASALLRGVSRVEVDNGPAGSQPSFRFRAASEPGDAKEYEICFKCHSSWTKQKPGEADIARVTNPANPSYHPIQAAGRNRIDPAAFAGGVTSETMVRCTDCHGASERGAIGLHGSSYEKLLRRPSATSDAPQTARKDDLCFTCHAFDVYANASSAVDVQKASRFNAPGSAGHAFHAGTQRIPCYACHDAHGSTRYGALIATGRLSGIAGYSQTPLGGSCMPSCHEPKLYKANYAR